MAVNTQGSPQALIESLQAQVNDLYEIHKIKTDQLSDDIFEVEQERDKSQAKVKELGGINKEMYANHREELARLKDKFKEYEYIGERLAAQDGMWLNLHAGAMEWVHGEFKRLKGE